MNKQKELGQFFTPLPVVEFIFSALRRLSGELRRPKVIDPACGEGAFLNYALEEGVTSPSRLYGLDKDKTIVGRWVEQGIYNKGMHLFIHDGLYEDEKTPGVIPGSFDWVVGNPPFGGLGLRGLQQLTTAIEGASLPSHARRGLVREEVPLFAVAKPAESAVSRPEPIQPSFRDLDLAHLRDLSRALVRDFSLWRDGVKQGMKASRQRGIEGLSAPHTPQAASHKPGKASHKFTISGVEFDAADLPSRRDIPRLERFRIEVLFFERFINLAKPGGFIAIIVPDGVLANSTMQYVRDWALGVCQLIAVVSLPRDTFKGTGTSAKASVLIMRKFGEAEAPDGKGKVLMATMEGLDALKELAEMFSNPVVKALKTVTPGLECSLVDPSQDLEAHRIDPQFWDPRHFEYRKFRRYRLSTLGSFIASITYGPIVTGKTPRDVGPDRGGVAIIGQKQLDDIGLDLTTATRTEPGSPWDVGRARVRHRDVLLPRSGVGSLGRARVGVFRLPHGGGPAVVSCFVDLVRLKGLAPEYVAVYLKTRFGRMQIERLKSGVGTINLDFDDVRAFEIHVAPPDVQRRVARAYTAIIGRYPPPRQAGTLDAACAELSALVRRLEELIEGKRETL